MRLKTFSAKSMAEVMDQVREEMGPDAIIVSIDQGKKLGGVRVTAAAERPARSTERMTVLRPRSKPAPARTDGRKAEPRRARPFDAAELTAVLSHHGVPYDTATRLHTVAEAVDGASLPEALAAAFETCVAFAPLPATAERPVMLVGPPGAGKTVSAAKIAADAVLNKRRVKLITTDTVRAAGAEQLAHFAALMKLKVATCETPEELAATVGDPGRPGGDGVLTVIDSRGINPFDMADVEQAVQMIKAADVEPVLVLPAGIDAMEAADMADIFSQMGARRLIATRLDIARRYASLLLATQHGRLALAALSRTPFVAGGFEPATALTLARLFANLPRPKSSSGAKPRPKKRASS